MAVSHKSAFLEGYDSMRYQYHLANDGLVAWEASASKRLLDEPEATKMEFFGGGIDKEVFVTYLNALAEKMRHGMSLNTADIPVSHDLESWVDELDIIIWKLVSSRVKN